MFTSKTRFLVVDDMQLMRHVVRNLLKDLGYLNSEEAVDGSAALKRLTTEKFDFVIVDWNMPKLDGLNFLQAVRSNPATAQIPVLMVTAEAKKENILAAADAGASGYIVKPFTATTLASKIQYIAEKIGGGAGR